MNDTTFGRLTRFGAVVGLALGLGFGVAGVSAATAKNTATQAAAQAPPGQPVDSFPILSRLHDWQVIDDKTVIVWATPWQPYLVQLKYPSHDLPFVQAIGITSLGDPQNYDLSLVLGGGQISLLQRRLASNTMPSHARRTKPQL